LGVRDEIVWSATGEWSQKRELREGIRGAAAIEVEKRA
jgi:hypothetical protein